VSYQSQDEFWVNRIIDLTITLSSNKVYTIYLDGNATISNSRSSDLNNNLLINRIGLFQTSSEPLQGSVYLSSFYNRALTPDEILQNYNAGLQRFIPTNGLVLSLDAQNTNLYATSPTTAYDVSGNDNNGTLINGVQYVADGNGSWSFDGVDDRITFSNPLNQLNLSQEWTICCWVNIKNNVTQTLISGLNLGIHLNWFGSNRPLLYLNSGPNDYYIYGENNLIVDKGWVHVCFSFRNSEGYRKIFINSVDKSAFGPNNTSTPSGIESTFTVGSGLNGNLTNIDMYNRVLSQTEITTIYNATKSRYGL
jgi:hypothetical protein